MLSTIPSSTTKLSKREVDLEMLRVGIIAELDAINLYEQLAASTENEELKKVFLEIAREEKTHFGEFQALLLRLDGEQVKELEKGKKEVEELTGR
ncbi:MAG: ferritin family protein [Candidatus Bathyarchaeales archaeon]